MGAADRFVPSGGRMCTRLTPPAPGGYDQGMQGIKW